MTHQQFIFAVSLLISFAALLANHQTSLYERSMTPRGDAPLYPLRSMHLFLFLRFFAFLFAFAYAGTLTFFFQQCFSQMLLHSILLTILLLLLPLLRKFLRAESCAFLWFTVFLTFGYGIGDYSLLVIDLPFSMPGPQTIKVLLIIWLSGRII